MNKLNLPCISRETKSLSSKVVAIGGKIPCMAITFINPKVSFCILLEILHVFIINGMTTIFKIMVSIIPTSEKLHHGFCPFTQFLGYILAIA